MEIAGPTELAEDAALQPTDWIFLMLCKVHGASADGYIPPVYYRWSYVATYILLFIYLRRSLWFKLIRYYICI